MSIKKDHGNSAFTTRLALGLSKKEFGLYFMVARSILAHTIVLSTSSHRVDVL